MSDTVMPGLPDVDEPEWTSSGLIKVGPFAFEPDFIEDELQDSLRYVAACLAARSFSETSRRNVQRERVAKAAEIITTAMRLASGPGGTAAVAEVIAKEILLAVDEGLV